MSSGIELIIFFFLFVLIWIVPLFYIYKIAKQKNREAALHVMVGFLSIPILWLVVVSSLKNK